MGAVLNQRGLEELFYVLNDTSIYLQTSCKGPNGDLGKNFADYIHTQRVCSMFVF